MNAFYATTAVIEVGAGLALLCLPSAAVDLLLGAPLDAPAALAAARIAAIALLTLGVACWFARDDFHSPAARGLVASMLLYNLGVVFILGATGIRSLTDGVGLWSAAVVLHLVMTIWCVLSLLSWKPRKPEFEPF